MNKFFKKALCRRLLVLVLGLLAFLGVSLFGVSNIFCFVMFLLSLSITIISLSFVLFLCEDYYDYLEIVDATKSKNLHYKVFLLLLPYGWRSYLPFCEIWELRNILRHVQSKVLKQDDPQIQLLKKDLLKHINKRRALKLSFFLAVIFPATPPLL